MKKQEIPIMFCFDNNYVIPAAVAFYSLLEHANKEYDYKFYILHTDITKENQEKLIENVKIFSDFSELIFVNMENKFEDLWETISTKGHFSKEVMYKILVASIFPIYEKIIVSDVDVVFLGDISESYFCLDTNDDYYLAGVKMIGKMQWYLDQLLGTFTRDEIEKLGGFCGGYIVFNLKKLREDNMEEKFVECFKKEGNRINQMEQDVLNLCCYPKTKRLPLKYLACSYMWDEYKSDEDKLTDIHYSKEEIDDAMENTVQLHYATSKKPWKNVDCTKSEIWFKYLMKTNFVKDYFEQLPQKIVLPENRIKEIEERKIEEMRDIMTAELTKEIQKQYTIKARINRKFEKNIIYRLFKYILKNTLFFMHKSFYDKIKKKLEKQKFSLIVIDDAFPSIYSAFRFEEYMEYLQNINSVKILTTGVSYSALNEHRKMDEVIKEFEMKYPQYKGKVTKLDVESKSNLKDLKNKICIVTFLQNMIGTIYDNLKMLENHKIPFIFTLYPGGGFILNDKDSDKKLKEIFQSKYFQRVIVTQKNTYEYLINKGLCDKEKIEFIYGVVTPKKILEHNNFRKNYYTFGKNTLDICFVAHKYCERGLDKGYDLFIEAAKELSKKHENIIFHVIGGFSEHDIDVNELNNKIIFYGLQTSDSLKNLYKKMDIIISPNRPNVLKEGAFDGFPTGSATEAMINGVTLICTDELKLNFKFKNNKDIIIIKPNTNEIIESVNRLYNNPKEIVKIAQRGKKKALKIYSNKNQIKPRIRLIKNVAKSYYKY